MRVPGAKQRMTIYDLIDDFWGRDPLKKIMRADKISLRKFGREVNQFYGSYVPRERAADDLRTYYGGLVAVNFSLAGKESTFFNNLLYSHSTIVPDPVARWYFDDYEKLSKTPDVEYLAGQAAVDQSEWIGWILNSDRAFRWDLDASRDVLRFYIAGLLQIRPLIESGIVVLVSQPHVLLSQSEAIVREALTDAGSDEFKSALLEIDEQLPLWDNARGGIMTPGDKADPARVRWAKAKEASYYIRKNLAIAASAGGRYIPDNLTDYGLLNAVLTSSGHRNGYLDWKFEVARAVNDIQLPSLEGLPITELISIREDSAAFEEFRVWLARRLFNTSPGDREAVLELTREELDNEINRLKRQLSTSNVIKTHLKENGLKIAVGALVGSASTLTIGQPFAGAVVGALAGLAAALIQRDHLAKNSVIARLAQMNRVAPDATFGKSGGLPGLPAVLARPFFGEFRTGPSLGSQTYSPSRLRQIVSQSLAPNETGNPLRAISGQNPQ